MRNLRETSRLVLALQLASVAVCLVGSVVSDHPLAFSGGSVAAKSLYVVTVDGTVRALDWEGNHKWSHQLAEPLFSSTLNYQVQSGVPTLIPGLNRALYNWDGSKLEQLAVMADDLVDKTFPYGEEAALAGAKFREVEAINSATGQLVYQCTAANCYQSPDQTVYHHWPQVLKASTYRVTVRLAQELSGEEMWNFTVGEVELSLVGGEKQEEEIVDGNLRLPLQVDAARGVVYGGREDQSQWQHQVSAPITAMWVQDGYRLNRVNLSSHSIHPKKHNHPALMMVQYNNKYYIQPMPPPPEYDPFQYYPPTSYKLAIIEEMARAEQQQQKNFELALYHNPNNLFDLCNNSLDGVSLYFTAEEPQDSCQHSKDENSSEESCAPSVAPTFIVESWWDLVVRKSVELAKYLLFGVFLVLLDRLHHKFGRTRTTSQSEVLEDREMIGDQVATRPSVESVGSTGNIFRRTQRADSTDSRFGSDYELRGRLGKGGFGIVYHVRNRTDDGEYAVKRILLPRKKSARDKVMREVHALAQLDHPKIVRYFHSWVEQAPEGWERQEEWVPLSRRESYAFAEYSPVQTSTLPSSSHVPSCPSFSSLSHDRIHSEVPPPLTSGSRSSSFVIEFCDKTGGGDSEEEEEEEEGGEEENRACFPRVFMDNRDDLSSCSTVSWNSEEEEEEERDGRQVEPPTYLFIQMQLCQKESLKDWLTQNVRNRQRRVVAGYFQQVLDAVAYVHMKGLMHRDLKPSNIFFSLEGSVKVGDFGLVTGSVFTGSQGSLIALKPLVEDSVRHTGNIGSHFYMSPEQAAGKKYDQKVDIYSLGIVYFELHYPFDTEMERVKVLENLRRKQMPKQFLKNMPQETELVNWLMETQAARRPTAEQVKESKVFRDLLRAATESSECNLIPKF